VCVDEDDFVLEGQGGNGTMQSLTGLMIAIIAIIITITYSLFLIKLDIIKLSRKKLIKDVTELVQFNLLTKCKFYAKIVDGNLHNDLYHREDYVSVFRTSSYPIFIIFGPHLL